MPPYYAYKYCSMGDSNIFKDYAFKTFEFSNKSFSRVGIATDGIMPVAKGDIEIFDRILRKENNIKIWEQNIRNNRRLFFDDVSIGIFDIGGIDNGNNR